MEDDMMVRQFGHEIQSVITWAGNKGLTEDQIYDTLQSFIDARNG